MASLIAVSSNPAMCPPPSTYAAGGCSGGGVVPCAGAAVAVGPIPGHVPAAVAAGPGGPYASTSSGSAVKTQMTSNGYVAMTPRPPSQAAALPAQLVPQVMSSHCESACERLAGTAKLGLYKALMISLYSLLETFNRQTAAKHNVQ